MNLFTIVFLINLIILINCEIPKLVILSFDAFRGDYLHPDLTPTMFELAQNGVSTDQMTSCYPTKTFSNHHSISTGLYVENHGIVNNDIYDPLFNSYFEMPNLEERWWNDKNVSTIWNLNEEFDNNRKSAVSMWPGSAVEYNGKKPKHIVGYQQNISLNDRMNKIIEWLTLEKDPANLILAYFNNVDRNAHRYGPFSMEIKKSIKDTDNSINYLVQKLKEKNLFNKINLIILSDHGISEIREERSLNLTKLCDSSDLIISGNSPNIDIFVKNKLNLNNVYNQLLNASKQLPFNVYKREEIPSKYHFNNHRRIGEIVIEGHIGYDVILEKSSTPFNELKANRLIKKMKDNIEKYSDIDKPIESDNIMDKFNDFNKRKNLLQFKIWGNHGYDNQHKDMRPLFLAIGPSFKTNYVYKTSFINIDLYSLACMILELNSDSLNPNNSYCKNDGDPLRIKNMLKTKFKSYLKYWLIAAIMATILLSGLIYFLITKLKKHK